MRFNFLIKKHLLLIAVSYWLNLFFKNYIGIYSFILISVFLILKLKEKALLAIIILFLPYVNYHNHSVMDYKGVSKVIADKYIIIDNAVVYTDKLLIDSLVEVKGEIVKLQPRLSFYSFDFNQYLINKGVYYQIKKPDIKVLKQAHTFLATIQRKIENFSDETDKAFLYKFLLNINYKNDIMTGFINAGFCFIGFFNLLKNILKKIIYQKNINFINIIVLGIFIILYNFKISLIRLLIYQLTNFLKLENEDKLGLSAILILFLFPYEIYNLGFYLSILYYGSYNLKFDKFSTLFYACFIQSLFTNSFNILSIILYRHLTYILGILYIMAVLTLILQYNYFTGIIILFSDLVQFIGRFNIYGNVLGIGIILILILYKYKKIRLVAFILIMKLSLVHPLCEVTFINIDQGDAILIRLPFNKANYLIDTGKETQYNYLKNYLHAKGIDKIDYLFITHNDSDHSGNISNLKKDFTIENLIDSHFNILDEDLFIYELNDNSYNNENDNSLINLIDINNLMFLFMGDASIKVEHDLIHNKDFLKVDILKLGHHGSKTSTSKMFIKNVKPKIAIISAGKNNSYNHPHPSIIKLLNNEGIFYLNTAESGDISIFIIFNFKFFYTSDGRIGII